MCFLTASLLGGKWVQKRFGKVTLVHEMTLITYEMHDYIVIQGSEYQRHLVMVTHLG